jgi:uncharacterized membrane protein YeiB
VTTEASTDLAPGLIQRAEIQGATAADVSRARIEGYDLARALAIFGMVVVHFALVMSSERAKQGGWAARLVEALDGRAAATFVVLAGVGITLRFRSAAAKTPDDDTGLARVRATLARRGLFLLAVGFLNLIVWQGDILRVYGVSLFVAAWLVNAPARWLWTAAVTFVVGFLVLMGTVDYSRNWDWETMHYHGLWTAPGAVRNLFYDGFRAVFPWTGLLLFGMWLGRHDLRETRTRTRFLAAGIGLAAGAGIVSRLLLRHALAHPDAWAMDRETAEAMLGTASMPPMPLFLLSAVGTAIFVIAASVWVAKRFAGWLVVRSMVAAGQMAFTWYVGHIVLGLGGVILLGLYDDQSVGAGVAAGTAFFALACVVSFFWRRRFRHGPLEWLMRRVAG